MSAGALALVLLSTMAWTTGGYFPAGHLPAGAVAFAALAVYAVARPPRWAPSNLALWGLAALAGMTAWAGLSSRWSEAPHVALEDMQRNFVYLGLLGLGIVAAGRGRFCRHLLWGAFALIVVIAGAGLVSRLYPGLLGYGPSESPFVAYRLSYPLSYWNALGAVGAMGLVVGVGLAADPRGHPALRGLAAALSVGVGTAAYLTFSRGSWIALVVGLLIVGAVTTRRGSFVVALAVIAPPLFAAVLRIDGLEALTTDPARGSGQAAQGRAYAPVLLALMAAAGALQALMAVWGASSVATHARMRLARPVAIAVLGVTLVGVLGAYVLRGSELEGGTALRIERIEGFVDREWNEFLEPSEVALGVGAERLTTVRGTRSDLYRVAIDGFEANPLVGDGAGSFEYRFARDRDVSEKVRDAHSLPLETLGELGVVGGALMVLFVGALVAGVLRQRKRRTALTGPQVAAVAGGFGVWAVHASVDWAWQMPVVTGLALILAASALSGQRVSPSAAQPHVGRREGRW